MSVTGSLSPSQVKATALSGSSILKSPLALYPSV
jgi:hypothetical protein